MWYLYKWLSSAKYFNWILIDKSKTKFSQSEKEFCNPVNWKNNLSMTAEKIRKPDILRRHLGHKEYPSKGWKEGRGWTRIKIWSLFIKCVYYATPNTHFRDEEAFVSIFKKALVRLVSSTQLWLENKRSSKNKVLKLCLQF